MITEEIVKVKRTFQLGDLFIVRERMKWSCHKVGDFLLINRMPTSVDPFIYFTTPHTANGSSSFSSGGAEWLNELLDGGIISYEGNVK